MPGISPFLLLKPYLAWLRYEKHYSERTLVAYETDLRSLQAFVVSEYEIDILATATGLAALRPVHIRAWLLAQTLSRSTLNRRLSAVRSFLRYHLRNGTLEQSLLLKFKLPKIQRKLPTVARQTQLNDALDNLVPAVQESVLPQSGDQSVQNQIVTYSFAKENPAPQGEWLALRDRVVMEVLYGCGLRCAELVGLTWAHIDWGQQQLRVRGKGNKTRLVPIGQSAQSALLAYRTALAAAGRSAEGPVVQTERGGPPYAKLVYNIVNRLLVESGQPGKASPHVLRHSYASHLLENGADLNAIKDLLGHSSLAATQIYVHTHPGRLKAVHSQAHPRSGK